jgi:cation diffusion facilitator CzcD-associated flavoprotein CzcO
VKNFIIKGAKKGLGDFPVDPHFIPNYNPWEQRFCIAPNGDFFRAIRKGKARVTDHIDRFTANGIVLESGKTLAADIITATGLDLVPLRRYYSIGFETFDLAVLCLQRVNDQ